MSAMRKPELVVVPAPAQVKEGADAEYSVPGPDLELLETWLSKKPNERTRGAYRADAMRFLLAVRRPLVELTELEYLQPWLDELTGLAPTSRRRAITAVRGLLTLGFGLGRLRCNLALALPLPPRPKKLPRVVERSEIIRVIEGERRPLRALVLRGYYLHGWRVSELLGATWSCLTSKDGRYWLRVVGKGDKERDVPLSAAFAAKLLELRGDAPDSAPVVNRSRQTIWRWVKELGRKSGYPDLSPHWLRHCCASHLLDAKVAPQEVQELLGHSSLATTTAYAHVQPEARPSEVLEWD